MADRPEVQLRVDGEFVVVSHPELATNSDAALFFDAVLGAELVDGEWRCPRRRSSISALVVRINTYLESAGWRVNRAAVADEAVRNEIERKRSFQRTKAEAKALREGHAPLDFTSVCKALRDAGWNEDTRRLLPHQRLAVVHGLTAINSANFSVPGAGKTASTLAIAATHFAKDTIDLVVVVGPLSCFAPWEKETRTALGSRLTAKRVRGTAVQRRATYGRARRGDLLLLSYATAASDKLSLIELCRANRVMLVVDESHRVKRFRGGCWAPALMETAKFARIRVILSGTPMPQSGRDLYSQLSILWPSGELTGARDDFASRVDNDFASLLEDVRPFVSRTPKDALGLPPYEIVRHEVPMAPTQEDVYALIEGDFRKRLERTDSWADKIEALKRAKPIRLLQAAANPDLLNKGDSFYSLQRFESVAPTLMDRLAAYADTEVPAKAQAALEIIKGISRESGKVVCWSNFVPNLDYFAGLVRRELRLPCFQIDGRVPAGDDAKDDLARPAKAQLEAAQTREEIIDEFLDCSGPAVLVTNPASCSESISLHRSCHNALYLDRTYDCALFLQSIDRIHRLGLPPGARVRVHVLMATSSGRNTIDQLVDASLLRKERTMMQLLLGAELLPFHLHEDPLEDAQGDEEDLGQLLRYLLGES